MGYSIIVGQNSHTLMKSIVYTAFSGALHADRLRN